MFSGSDTQTQTLAAPTTAGTGFSVVRRETIGPQSLVIREDESCGAAT